MDTMEALGEWLNFLDTSFAEGTQKTYRKAAMLFLSHYPIPLSDVTVREVAGFLASFPPRSAARRTYYQALKSLFGYALRRNLVTHDPTEFMRPPPVIQKEPRALSEEEFEALVQAATRRGGMRPWYILLLYYTGARVTESVNIKWSDISEESLLLRVTKNGKERTIPMCPGLHDTLAELFKFTGHQDYVIPRSTGTCWQWLKQCGDDAGIARVHPHLIRATAATRMLVRGARPHAVQGILGHSSLKVTSRYWAIEETDKAAAVELLER